MQMQVPLKVHDHCSSLWIRRSATTSTPRKLRRCCIVLLAAVCGTFASASGHGATWSAPARRAVNSVPPSALDGIVSFGKIGEQTLQGNQVMHEEPCDWSESFYGVVRMLCCLVCVAAVALVPLSPNDAAHAGLMTDYGKTMSYETLKDPLSSQNNLKNPTEMTPYEKAKKAADDKKAAQAKRAAEAKAEAQKKKTAAEKKAAEAKKALEAKKADAAKKAADEKAAKQAANAKKAADAKVNFGARKAEAGVKVQEANAPATPGTAQKQAMRSRPVPKQGSAGFVLADSGELAFANQEDATTSLKASEKVKSDAIARAQTSAQNLKLVEQELQAADDAYKRAEDADRPARLKTLKAVREKRSAAEKEVKAAEAVVQQSQRDLNVAKKTADTTAKCFVSTTSEIKQKLKEIREGSKVRLEQDLKRAMDEEKDAKRTIVELTGRVQLVGKQAQDAKSKASALTAQSKAELAASQKLAEKADPGDLISSPKREAMKQALEKERIFKRSVATEKALQKQSEADLANLKEDILGAQKKERDSVSKQRALQGAIDTANQEETALQEVLNKLEPPKPKMFFGLF